MLEQYNVLMANAYFGLFAAIALGCGIGLLISRHPLNGALNLVGVMLAMAGIYSLQASPFLGVLQILVYAGAIMMLVVFVIMVLNQAKDHVVPAPDGYSFLLLAVPVAVGLAFTSLHATKAPVQGDAHALRATVESIAPTLFDVAPAGPGYYVLFELIGVLLLVAVVAAVLLAKRNLESDLSDDHAEDGHDHH